MFPVKKKGIRTTLSFCERVGTHFPEQMQRHLKELIIEKKVEISKSQDGSWILKSYPEGKRIEVQPDKGFWLIVFKGEGVSKFTVLPEDSKEILRWYKCEYNGKIIAPLFISD